MRRSAPWLTAALQMVLLLVVVAAASPWLDANATPLPTPRRSSDVTLAGRDARPIYNHSIVPGGVYSVGELRDAIARDPVVAAHYRHADLRSMRAVTLMTGRSAHVSYRVGDRVYWTRRRVWLRPGETVLTDGTTTIRARCGNCVSDVAEGGAAAVDPAQGELDEAVVPPSVIETGVSPVSGEAEEALGDLLEVPFAPDMLASLAPGPVMTPPHLLGGHFGPGLLSPGGGTTTGSTPTTGSVTTGQITTGRVTSGSLTTGEVTTGSLTTSGSPTTGELTGEVTTGAVTTGTRVAPEPELLWLVACGVFGLASRRFRSR